jgi:hypothetical protein
MLEPCAQICNCPSVTLQEACCRLALLYEADVRRPKWDAFTSRTGSAEEYPTWCRLEAWFCQMTFLDEEVKHPLDWSKVLQGMPFWARQLIAVMISSYAIQVLMDDGIIANEMLVQAQLDMWRIQGT